MTEFEPRQVQSHEMTLVSISVYIDSISRSAVIESDVHWFCLPSVVTFGTITLTVGRNQVDVDKKINSRKKGRHEAC